MKIVTRVVQWNSNSSNLWITTILRSIMHNIELDLWQQSFKIVVPSTSKRSTSQQGKYMSTHHINVTDMMSRHVITTCIPDSCNSRCIYTLRSRSSRYVFTKCNTVRNLEMYQYTSCTLQVHP